MIGVNICLLIEGGCPHPELAQPWSHVDDVAGDDRRDEGRQPERLLLKQQLKRDAARPAGGGAGSDRRCHQPRARSVMDAGTTTKRKK